jgi:hypothetical protein
VAAGLHSDAFRYAIVDHVPDGGAPEIVPEHPHEAGLLAAGNRLSHLEVAPLPRLPLQLLEI